MEVTGKITETMAILTVNRRKIIWQTQLLIPPKHMATNSTPASSAPSRQPLRALFSKYLTQLEYGTVDLDTTYPEFLDALDKAGINKIIEENQKQLDAWLAAQQ